MKKLILLPFVILIVLMALTLSLKNPQDVALNYYFGLSWEGPVALALILTFVFGLLIGWLLMSFSVLKNKRVVGKTKRQLAKVEKEVENLRAMPIKDDALPG